MTTTEKEALLAKRKGLIEDARATIELSREANSGQESLEAVDQANKLMDAADEIRRKIEAADLAESKARSFNARLAEAENNLRSGTGRMMRPTQPGGETAGVSNKLVWAGREIDLSIREEWVRRNSDKYRTDFANHLVQPNASFMLDKADQGGIFAPPQFVGQLIKELDEDFAFRALATKVPPTTARELAYPRRTTRERRLTKGQVWSASGTDGKLGEMKLVLHPWTGEAQINKALKMFSPFDVEGFVRNEIRYDISATQEDLFMDGTGQQEPAGIFVALDHGLPSTRDTTTTLTWDNLVNFRMSLRDVYLKSRSVRCFSHRNFQKALMKIRTTDGVPLYQPSLVVGQPDTFLGIPMTFSEFAPSGTGGSGTYASGDYVAVIGDFSQYWIFDSMDMPIEQHNLDTRSNLDSYLYRIWFDGGVAMPEAFSRLKIT